jgi:hypothetical protein
VERGGFFGPTPVPMPRPNRGAAGIPRTPVVDPANLETWAAGEAVLTEKLTTDATTGKAVATAKLPAGIYRAVFEIPASGDVPAVKSELIVEVFDPQAEKYGVRRAFTFVSPKTALEPLAEYRGFIGTGYDRGRALVEISQAGKVLERFWTQPGRTQWPVSLKVTDAHRGGFTVRAWMVRDGRLHSESRTIDVPTAADSLDYYVRALETTGKFRILSRPVVYTTNNKKAVISSGQRVPYTSSTLTSTSITGVGPNQSAGVTANITYLDVLLKLEVLPLINANKDVTLVIVQTNNNVLREEEFGGGNRAPVVGAQELTTTVTVPSGGTVVLGGLIVEKTDANDGGLPFLMRLPVLGYIFKQTTRAVERRELLVLLQPTVVENDAETAVASAEERYRTKLGDEVYDESDAWQLGRTPVVDDSPMLAPDARVRKPRDPLRPAGIDYQEYAPTPRPTPKPTPVKKKRSAS